MIENIRAAGNKWLIILLMLLCAAVGMGSICLMKTGSDAMVQIRQYLTSFFSGMSDSVAKSDVLKNALTENIILALLIFVCGFFKAGTVIVALCIARKGFIMGFTSASMIECFGIKGLIINAAYLPTVIVMIPAFIVFSALSMTSAYGCAVNKKNFVAFYIVFAIITITIFCAAAVFEAYLTTTFMNFMASKL